MPGTFATDLTTVLNGTTPADAEATTNWVTGGLGTFSVVPRLDVGVKVQGGNGLIGSGPAAANQTVYYGYTPSPTLNLTDGRHVFGWFQASSTGVADTLANGGVRAFIGSGGMGTAAGTAPSTDGFQNAKHWRLDGVDTDKYGGWHCYVIDPQGTASFSWGTPNIAAVNTIGFGLRSTAAIKDVTFNFCVDALRVGIGHTVTAGTAGAPVTLNDIATWDALNANTYGVLILKSGTYYCGGKLRFGTNAQAAITYFKDTSKTLMFHDYPVAATFYEIILAGTASNGTTFMLGSKSGTSTSGGCLLRAIGARQFALTCADAYGAMLLYGTTFIGMRQATLNAISEVRNCSFVNSGTLIPAGAVVTGCSFASGNASTAAIQVASPAECANVTKCDFSNCYAGVKITAAGTYVFDGLTFDGAAGTYDIDNASGGAIVVNCVGGSNASQARVLTSVVGGTHTINNTLNVKLNNLQASTEVRVYTSGTTTEYTPGIETVTTPDADPSHPNKYEWSFGMKAGDAVDIAIVSVGYQDIWITGYRTSTDAIVPIFQQYDRQYAA